MSTEILEELGQFSEQEEDDDDLSPSKHVRHSCYPLNDYELVKIYECHIRIFDNLLAIQSDWRKGDENNIDDPQEIEKTKRRAAEFSTRFSRNHLYPLQLEVNKLEKYILSKDLYESKNKEVLRKKMTAVYQEAVNSVSTYISYMNAPKKVHVVDKINDLIAILKKLNSTCQNILTPVLDSLGGSAKDAFDEFCESFSIELKTPKVVTKLKKVKTKKKNVNMKQNLLEMYEPKLGLWKRKAETLRKLKMANQKRREKAQEERKPLEKENEKQIAEAKPKDVRRLAVSPDMDIQTEIEKYDLREAKTKEDVRISDDLRSTLREALNDAEKGEDQSALSKLQQICLSTTVPKVNAPNNKPRDNIGLYCIKSARWDEPEESTEEVEERPISPQAVEELAENVEKPRTLFQPICRKNVAKRLLKIPEALAKEYEEFGKTVRKFMQVEDFESSWGIISRISDVLLDEILGDVLEEVTDEKVLENLFENELKNF